MIYRGLKRSETLISQSPIEGWNNEQTYCSHNVPNDEASSLES